LSDYEPGNIFSIQHNSPGLRTARKLILYSIRLQSGDPTVPAICEFRGART